MLFPRTSAYVVCLSTSTQCSDGSSCGIELLLRAPGCVACRPEVISKAGSVMYPMLLVLSTLWSSSPLSTVFCFRQCPCTQHTQLFVFQLGQLWQRPCKSTRHAKLSTDTSSVRTRGKSRIWRQEVNDTLRYCEGYCRFTQATL